MKLKDIALAVNEGRSLLHATSHWNQYRVWVLSTETYRSVDYREVQRGKDHYVPRGTGPLWGQQKTGLLALKVTTWGGKKLTKAQCEELASVQLREVVRTGELPDGVAEGITVEVVLVQARHLIGDWDEQMDLRAEGDRKREETEAKAEALRVARATRMEEVVRVLNLLNATPGAPPRYRVYSHESSERLSVNLADLEALVDIAKTAFPLAFAQHDAEG